MANNYFVNCRGVTLTPTYPDEWVKSGHLPRLSTPFIGYASGLDNDVMIFCGSTKTATWIHFDPSSVTQQIEYLRGLGVNLIRVYADLYCWASLGADYLSSVKHIANVCDDNQIYVQWVLFDGYTHEDTSGTSHAYGKYDPSNIYQAIAWGLKRWQRCPNIGDSSFMGRNPSSMTVSGNDYIKDMFNTLSRNRSTKIWEVMHDVNILSTETSGYDFLLAAVNKVNDLIAGTTQVATVSIRNLNAFSTPISGTTYPDIYKRRFNEEIVPLLNHVCYIDTGSTYTARASNYLYAYQFSVSSGKPVMALDSFGVKLDELSHSIDHWKKLKVGFITEGVIDRNLGNKPYNNTRGIFYDDGQTRRSVDASAIRNKAFYDAIYRKVTLDFTPIVTSSITEKSTFTNLVSSYVSSTYTRLSQFYDYGENLFSSMMLARTRFPEYSGVTVGYAPVEASSSAKGNGWGLLGSKNYFHTTSSLNFSTKSNLLATLIELSLDISVTPLSGISDVITRDREAYRRINILNELYASLPLYYGHNFYNQGSYGVGLVPSAYQIDLSSNAVGFLPVSEWNLNTSCITPYIGTQRYFSSVANLSSPFFDSISECQKPICYYIRSAGYPSGACLYNSSASINTAISATENVISKLNWAAYDVKLQAYVLSIFNAYSAYITSFNSYASANYPNSALDLFLQEMNST